MLSWNTFKRLLYHSSVCVACLNRCVYCCIVSAQGILQGHFHRISASPLVHYYMLESHLAESSRQTKLHMYILVICMQLDIARGQGMAVEVEGRLKGRTAQPLAADYDGSVVAIGFEDGMVRQVASTAD